MGRWSKQMVLAWRYLGLMVLLIGVSASVARGQDGGGSGGESSLDDARHDLVEKTRSYKSGIEALLVFLREDVGQRQSKADSCEELFKQGYISKVELEAARARLNEAIRRRDEQEKELVAASQVLAEAMAAEEAVGMETVPKGDAPTVLRFKGTHLWTLAETSEVANFYWKRFGRELPISAYGQTPTHDALGFDHRNRIDVAVNPTSPEGRALMSYLREHAISFIGFAGPVTGSATGAHIHLGPPSTRKN